MNKQTKVPARGRLRCPHCGGEMNLHAEKIDYNAAITSPESVDPMLGGVVEEFLTCPSCHLTLERPERGP